MRCSCSCMVHQGSGAVSPAATLFPIRCTCHILRSDTRCFQVYICKSPTRQLRRRSLLSITMIGGSPRQMEVSLVPKSIENLSRPCNEMPSVWCEEHEHRDGPVLHLLWIKRRRTSELTALVFKGTCGSKVWMSHQHGLKIAGWMSPLPSKEQPPNSHCALGSLGHFDFIHFQDLISSWTFLSSVLGVCSAARNQQHSGIS